jgi:hypothetical protein
VANKWIFKKTLRRRRFSPKYPLIHLKLKKINKGDRKQGVSGGTPTTDRISTNSGNKWIQVDKWLTIDIVDVSPILLFLQVDASGYLRPRPKRKPAFRHS